MRGRDSGSYPGAGENVTVFYSTDGMRSWKNQTALTITGTTWNTSVGKGRYVKEFFDVFWMEIAKTARKPVLPGPTLFIARTLRAILLPFDFCRRLNGTDVYIMSFDFRDPHTPGAWNQQFAVSKDLLHWRLLDPSIYGMASDVEHGDAAIRFSESDDYW